MIYDAEGHIENEDVWMLMGPRLEGTGADDAKSERRKLSSKETLALIPKYP